MYTSTILLTTSLLATLASSQKTSVYAGEPEEFNPSYSLNPTQSAILSKYKGDIASATAAFPNEAAYASVYATASFSRIPQSEDPYVAALKGAPIPTDSPELAVLPASLRDPLISAYEAAATIASQDLSADPSLASIAPYLVVAVEETTPLETIVLPTTGKYAPTGAYGTGWGKGYGHSASTSFSTLTTSASASASTVSGVAAPSGVAASSGSGASSGAASSSGGQSSSSSSSATSSPIVSAKPASGAHRISAGVGGLLVVGLGFVALL